MDSMEIVRESGQSPDTAIFRLNGPFTLSTMFGLQNDLRAADVKNVIIDLTNVPYMDSAGLGVLLGQTAHCQRLGNKMALAGVSPRVLTIFEITHTDSMMSFFPTAEAADASFA